MGAVADAQEAGALLERLRAEPADRLQLRATLEGAVLLAVLDDLGRERRPNAGDAREQRRRRRVELDADAVHAVLDHLLELRAEHRRVDVVLVLADADRLRVDLHQLRERVLQPARDRDGAAHRHVEQGNSARATSLAE